MNTNPHAGSSLDSFLDEFIDPLTKDDEVVQKFIESCQAIINEHYARNFERLIPPTLRVDERDKFLFVYKHEEATGNDSAYCFIARTTFQNKSLGKVKRGEVYKCASWKVPGKHARGNVFSANPSSGMTSYGAVYLKNR